MIPLRPLPAAAARSQPRIPARRATIRRHLKMRYLFLRFLIVFFMLLFQFLKHRLPPTAPRTGAAHTSGLENWVGFFALSDVDQWFAGYDNISAGLKLSGSSVVIFNDIDFLTVFGGVEVLFFASVSE